MRKYSALLLLVAFSWIGGLAQDARAGVTVDVLFQDGTGRVLTIPHGDPGPGCEFGGYYRGSVSTGVCMDVILRTTYESIAIATHVTYDTDNGLALASAYEWKGVGVSFNKAGDAVKSCAPPAGLGDDDGSFVGNDSGSIGMFDCIVPPAPGPTMAPGTYRLGTIIWDTSGTTDGSETISAYIHDVFDGFVPIINGNIAIFGSADIEVGSAVLYLSPEPGTAALLGLGLVGLVISARRRRPVTR